MNRTITPAPVRKSVTVQADPQRAFDVFTGRFDAWWPRSHHIGASDMRRAVLEPRPGGRWYEIGVDGAECPWGEVLVWEPPRRLVLAWRIQPDWRFDPDLLTEVEVTFTATEDGSTRVDLEHRGLERMGEAGQTAKAIFESPNGWSGLLALYAEAVG